MANVRRSDGNKHDIVGEIVARQQVLAMEICILFRLQVNLRNDKIGVNLFKFIERKLRNLWQTSSISL